MRVMQRTIQKGFGELPGVYDGESGWVLGPKLVEAARREDMYAICRIGLVEEVRVEVCRRSARILKEGGADSSGARCRLGARYFMRKEEKYPPDAFAAMPPL